jgi:hypothetical protein
VQLTETCDLWRMVLQPNGGREMSAVLTRVPCLRVPVSTIDKVEAALSAATTNTNPSEYFRSEARQSTDMFLLPDWLQVQTDDELRRGRYTDNNGDIVPYRYSVDGIRTYETFGYQGTICVFCSLLQ